MQMRKVTASFLHALYHSDDLRQMCLRYVRFQPEYIPLVNRSIQDTFVLALQSHAQLAQLEHAQLEAWLCGTCWHCFKAALQVYERRKHWYLATVIEGLRKLPSKVLTACECIATPYDPAAVDALLRLLNERERSVLLCQLDEGLCHKQIAAREATSIDVIRGVQARALAKLRKAVASEPQLYLGYLLHAASQSKAMP